MMVLGFQRPAQLVSGRRLKTHTFERRSTLPVSAACLVANHTRERLSEIFGQPVELRLLEPVLPAPQAWESIARDALIFAFGGRTCDAAFILRPEDASAITGAAFGEPALPVRNLSEFESEMLGRIIASLGGSLAPLCGSRDGNSITTLRSLGGFTTYFELILEQPVEARLGIAMSADPLPEATSILGSQALADLNIELSAEIAHASLPASALAGLRPGTAIRFESRLGDDAMLRSGNLVLARGECGVAGGRAVFVVS